MFIQLSPEADLRDPPPSPSLFGGTHVKPRYYESL